MKRNYTGNKGGQGIRETILNHVPKSKSYFSLFFGGGGLETCKYLKGINWIVSEIDKTLHEFALKNGYTVFPDYRSLVEAFTFTQEDFIFCDPPYWFPTRKSGKKYYKHEFTKAQHVDFLNFISSCNAKVIITHPECNLYDTHLKNWVKVPFSYMTQNGWYHDCMYMNFKSCSTELYTYACLGHNNTVRQQIKRKRTNMITKINNMPYHERTAILKAIQQNYEPK